MTNEDLLKLKIDLVSVKDTKNFLEIAILVDKPEFLEMLSQIRKDFEIKELIDIDEYETLGFKDPFGPNFNKYKKKYEHLKLDDSGSYDIDEPIYKCGVQKMINFSKYKNPEYLKNFANKNATLSSPLAIFDLEEQMDLFQMIDTEINLICLQFKRPQYFSPMIRQAIFCGEVNEIYFHQMEIEIISQDFLYSTDGYFQLPRLAIFISPTTTYEEIKSAFRKAQNLYKEDKRLTYYKPRTEYVDNIKKYRIWYWERQKKGSNGKNKTFESIVNDWVEFHLEDREKDETDIIKGVYKYQKLLTL